MTNCRKCTLKYLGIKGHDVIYPQLVQTHRHTHRHTHTHKCIDADRVKC